MNGTRDESKREKCMTRVQIEKKIRLLLVDDHQVMLEGLMLFFKNYDHIEVCATARNLHEGLEAARKYQPDAAVVDLSLQNNTGLDLIQDMQVQHPTVKCVVLSMHDELLYGERALKAGAKGYVMKSQSFETVVNALQTVMKGDLFFCDSIIKSVLNSFSQQTIYSSQNAIQSLSNRELEVFKLIGKGLRPRHIAEELVMSTRTVDTHCQRIRAKLQIDNMKDLIQFASAHVNMLNS
ncbi:response regulator transcription factor [bacterium]|nr:response regulator transcription factor [bacterium]